MVSSIVLKELLQAIWKCLPAPLRRWSMRVSHTKFTVTVGAVIIDHNGQVLLLKHRFRPGSGWGIPGGFIEAGEHPEEALRRELREEVGLELENLEMLKIRSFATQNQLEIVFRTQPAGTAEPQSPEVTKACWFRAESLPEGLPSGQRLLIKEAFESWSKNDD